jgi:high-affinity iron transporter
MLQSFVITFREGLESFLIVAISLAYLRKAGKNALVPAVHWGVGSALVMSVVAGIFLNRAANQSLWEALLAIVSAVLVGSMTIHMWRTARVLKKNIETHLGSSSMKAGAAAFLGVFLFTLLMITREGMETALLMNALIFQMHAWQMVLGCTAGLLAAGGVAWAWSHYGHHINLARFLQVTSIFLLVFVVQLLIYGFHELTESGVLPLDERWHAMTEPYGPDGFYGHLLSYMLVALPLAWLFWAWLKERKSLIES